MSLIQRNSSAVKFYGIVYRGNFNPDRDLEWLAQTHKMVVFRTMLTSVLRIGFSNVLFDTNIYGYVLKPQVDLEEDLVKAGKDSVQCSCLLMSEEIQFEQSMYRRVARDIISILNQFCERKFYNGPAILMARALVNLGCLLASFSERFINDEIKQAAEALGGSAHGSQYNTRVAYMNAIGHSEYDDNYENALNENEFDYYDEYVFDAMEAYLRQGMRCPSTTFTHDFGATYGNLMTLVGECQSGALDAEDVKLTLGGCRVLNYSKKAFTFLLTESKLKIMKMTREDDVGSVHQFDFIHEYCQRMPARMVNGRKMRPPKNRWDYKRGVEKAIELIAKCVGEMEPHLALFHQLAGTWDYAAATSIDWHPADVKRFYYEFYRGEEMFDRYPPEMKEAVRKGFADFMQARENADADAIMADPHPSDEEDEEELLPDESD